MTTRINEQALRRLLEGPAVARAVERSAAEIRDAARQEARRIMHRMPEADWQAVAGAIDYRMTGVEARIGLRPEGKIAEYLARKAVREGEQGWLKKAVREVEQRRR